MQFSHRAMLCMAQDVRPSIRLSVRPFDRLSHASILSKRLDIDKRHRREATLF